MSEISNKKAGAKFVVSENGDVVYEVELDDGKVKKVLAKDALKEIYKYMHGTKLYGTQSKIGAEKCFFSELKEAWF